MFYIKINQKADAKSTLSIPEHEDRIGSSSTIMQVNRRIGRYFLTNCSAYSGEMISRLVEKSILAEMDKGFVVGLFGARRTGKTVLMNYLKEQFDGVLYVQGDNLDIAEILSQPMLSLLEPFLKGYRYLFIDEAQEIRGIGKTLKLIADTWPGLRIFVTGSSAMDMRNSIGEPLVGRSKFFNLFPIAQIELNETFFEARTRLEQMLIFGGYPQVINAETPEEKASVLASLRNGYLLKDILMLDRTKDPVFILNLLRLLAFQTGNDVSFSELAFSLKVSHHTVPRMSSSGVQNWPGHPKPLCRRIPGRVLKP